ncbi:hypothetical protein QL285_042122 [Trifolium repens]|nr:hypothetical protein QL285_042122 [Trifolium repens]
MTASTTKKYYKIQHSKNTNTLKFVLKKQPAPKTTRNNREKNVGKKNNKEQATLEARLSDNILHHFHQITDRLTERIAEGIKKGFVELAIAKEINKGIQMHTALQETKKLEADIDKAVAMDMGSDINISG